MNYVKCRKEKKFFLNNLSYFNPKVFKKYISGLLIKKISTC